MIKQHYDHETIFYENGNWILLQFIQGLNLRPEKSVIRRKLIFKETDVGRRIHAHCTMHIVVDYVNV